MKAACRVPGGPFPTGLVCERIGGTPKSEPNRLSSILNWKHLGLCALALAFSPLPSHAQRSGTPSIAVGGPGTASSLPCNSAGYRCSGVEPEWKGTDTIPPLPPPEALEDDKCLPWSLSEGKAAAVSVTRLKIPSNASHEYEKACDANNKKHFDEAEQHARSAIEKFQNYPQAWVLLGLILDRQDKGPEAVEACSHAATIDSTYLPGYLCETELSAKKQDWEEALSRASIGLGLNSEGDGYVYYYRAAAYFHMNQLDAAKKSALQAAAIDVKRNEPSLDFLLAQIYDAQGDKDNAAAQLRKVLKHHNDSQQEAAAKQFLAKLASESDTK